MKRYLVLALFVPSLAWAGDDYFECTKHDGEVHCKAKLDNVAIQSIEINGGKCPSPVNEALHHKVMIKGDKFTVPGSKECHYVSKITIHTHDGKTQHIHAL